MLGVPPRRPLHVRGQSGWAVGLASALLQAFRRNPRDRAIAALAIPALGTLAIDPLVSIVDTVWVSRIGTESLAAVAIGSAVFAVVFSVFGFVHVTVTPLVAREVGRQHSKRAGDIAKGAIIVSVVIGVVLAAIVAATSESIVSVFGASGSVSAQAALYLQIRILALPAMLVAMVGHGVYRGHQDTRTPLYVAVLMNVVNLVVDPIFIFGLGMGIAGAAWATVLAQSVSAAVFLVLMFRRDKVRLGLVGRLSSIKGLRVWTIVAEGWPMMVRSAALLFALTISTIAASRIGTVEVAAHQIALQVWLFAAFVLDSLAVAAMAMIAMDLGRADIGAARDLGHRLLALGLMLGLALGVALAALTPFLGGFFSAEVSVSAGLSSIMLIVILLQPVSALVYVWDGVAIGTSAFPFMAVAMVVAAVATVVSLALVGDTLVGVWLSIGVLTVTRLVAFVGWQRFGPFSHARGQSPSSRAAA